MTQTIPFSESAKHHLILGLIFSVWLCLFLVFVGPYDAAEISMKSRLLIMPGYGLVFVLIYACCTLVQNEIFHITKTWNIFLESLILMAFFGLLLLGTFVYYKSRIVLGEYPFNEYLTDIFLPTMAMFLPLLYAGRWSLARFQSSNNSKSNGLIKIIGENKSDVLHLKLKHLVCIKSSDNYIEIYFLKNEEFQKKLFRTTLKKMEEDVTQLVRVHRSYLINPIHFSSWSDKNSIDLTYIHVPVSAKYQDVISNALFNHP